MELMATLAVCWLFWGLLDQSFHFMKIVNLFLLHENTAGQDHSLIFTEFGPQHLEIRDVQRDVQRDV